MSVREREDQGGRESEYDLLTAALIGATIGAGLTYMLRRGMSGDRPVAPVMRGIRTGAKWAGRHANHLSRRGGKWAQRQGRDLWDRVPRDEISDHVSDYADNMSDYVGRARHAIDDAVQSELKDLRRSIRRQRKRLGI